MSTVFLWKEAYTVKVAAMDFQHKTLFQIAHELHTAMGLGQGKTVTKDILDRLVGYTVSHFAAEERLMEKYNYPDLPSHRDEHYFVMQQVLEFKQKFQAGATDITPKLLTFLQQWLKQHIQTVDRRYGDFLNAHGIQ